MKAETKPAVPAAPAPEVDDRPQVDDSEFSIDSASAMPVETPDDTTQVPHPDFAEQNAANAQAEAATAQAAADTATAPAKGSAKPTPPAAKDAAPAKGAAAPAADGKGKPNRMERRVQERQRDLDRITYEFRETERKLEEKRKELTGLTGLTGSAPKPATADAASTQLPKVPQYRDFDTDEAYNTAMAKYEADVAKVIEARETAARSTVEATVTERETQAVQEAAIRTIGETVERAKTRYPDWSEKAGALQGVRSSWFTPDPVKLPHVQTGTPFLSDLVQTLMAEGHDEGADLIPFLGSDLERAQILADLEPTKAIRDALVLDPPAVQPLLEYFSTDAGQDHFEELRRMHPLRVARAIGQLSARLEAASSGSAPTVVPPITSAKPAGRPPAGEPSRGAAPAPGAKKPFLDWMAEEDAKELAKKKELAGISA